MNTPQINTPELWQHLMPQPNAASNKYTRGYALIVGGYPITGAARLAALASARTGAGLTTIACPQIALSIYASSLLSIITKPFDSDSTFNVLIDDSRINAYLIGPGTGNAPETQAKVLAILARKKPTVLDADAISVFAGDLPALRTAIQAPCVLTPHEGEFKRLCNLADSRIESALQAAKQANAVVLLKGAETIIAHPDDRVIINKNAPATLATAGSGDVLAGIITGLLAQGLPALEAAAAGTWMHAEAGRLFGLGLIAEDLVEILPTALNNLYS